MCFFTNAALPDGSATHLQIIYTFLACNVSALMLFITAPQFYFFETWFS